MAVMPAAMTTTPAATVTRQRGEQKKQHREERNPRDPSQHHCWTRLTVRQAPCAVNAALGPETEGKGLSTGAEVRSFQQFNQWRGGRSTAPRAIRRVLP